MGDEQMKNGLLESIHYSPIATLVTNPRLPDNPIVAANEAFCKLTGYLKKEILGRNCRFLAGPNTSSSARALVRAAVAQGKPLLIELLNYRKDGTAFQNALMIAPVLGEAGEIVYFIGSQMDVGHGSNVSPPRHGRAADLVAALTPRQRQVLERMIRGYRNKQIAALLGIDEKTVKMHRASMLAKLGAATSADAVRIGVEAGL